MNNSYFPMRYLATVALLLFGSMSVAPAIPPAFLSKKNGKFIDRKSISGEVTHVDQNARTFKVHWLSRGGSWEATVNTTEKTTYVSGSWTDMKKGIQVKFTCHLEGPNSDTWRKAGTGG
jgi:hypothetical protein